MGGPAMIEGGGLGVVPPGGGRPGRRPGANGVIDVVVEDEAEAVAAAKHYLSYFQGRTASLSAPISGGCARRSRRTGCGSTTSAR